MRNLIIGAACFAATALVIPTQGHSTSFLNKFLTRYTNPKERQKLGEDTTAEFCLFKEKSPEPDKIDASILVKDTIPRTFVLAVGESDYPEGLTDIPDAEKDADEISNYFRDHVNPSKLKLVNLHNASVEEILSQLMDFLNELSPKDHLIFYFSGLGAPKGLITTPGTKGTDYPGILHFSQLNKYLRKSGAQVTVIIDACYSGGFKDECEKRFNLLLSCQPDQLSADIPSFNHSLFTYSLLKAIQETNTLDTKTLNRISRSMQHIMKTQKPVFSVETPNTALIFKQ